MRDRVAERVVLQMPDVRLAARVRAASRARRTSSARRRATRGRHPPAARSAPPTCARAPTPPATWARSASGRSVGRASPVGGYLRGCGAAVRRGFLRAWPTSPALPSDVAEKRTRSKRPDHRPHRQQPTVSPTIIGAAEDAAEQMRRQAEQRMRDRIAEADRAGREPGDRGRGRGRRDRRSGARRRPIALRDAGRAEVERAKTTAATTAAAILARANEEAVKTTS